MFECWSMNALFKLRPFMLWQPKFGSWRSAAEGHWGKSFLGFWSADKYVWLYAPKINFCLARICESHLPRPFSISRHSPSNNSCFSLPHKSPAADVSIVSSGTQSVKISLAICSTSSWRYSIVAGQGPEKGLTEKTYFWLKIDKTKTHSLYKTRDERKSAMIHVESYNMIQWDRARERERGREREREREWERGRERERERGIWLTCFRVNSKMNKKTGR